MSRLSRSALLVAVALAVGAAVGLSPVSAAPASSGSLRSATIIAPRWVYLDGDIPVGVRVVAHQSSGRVRAELDLLDVSGTSRWRAVQTRTDLGSVTYEYSFFRRIAETGVPAGTYTLRTRVSGPGATAIERTARLIVVDRTTQTVPLCVVVRVTGTPMTSSTPSAAETTASRLSATDAAELGRLAILHPELHLSIAVPPFLLDEWRTEASGAGTTTPAPWSDALDSLRRAASSGTPVLRGFYSDPDLAAIAEATGDLQRQLTSGDAALAAIFAREGVASSTTATGLAALSGPLPEAAAAQAARSGVRFAVAGASAILPSGSGPADPGPYIVDLPARSGSAAATLSILAIDRAASRALEDPAATDALAAGLFDVAASSRPARTVVIELVVGPDGARVSDLETALASLTGLPWIRFVDAPSAAAAAGSPKATLRTHPTDPTPAPAGYWATIDDARKQVAGLMAAAGMDDPDAALALRRLLLAESRAWAGADGSWSGAAQGLSLAKAADEAARSILKKVTLDAPAVTLPGSEGKVPVSVTNSSDRNLTIVLEASSPTLRIRKERTTVRLKPGENVLSVPVALGTATSGRLKVAVMAGPLQIATSTVTVRASYQDRVVLLLAAVLILVGLLFYIRRRMALASIGRDADSSADAEGPVGT